MVVVKTKLETKSEKLISGLMEAEENRKKGEPRESDGNGTSRDRKESDGTEVPKRAGKNSEQRERVVRENTQSFREKRGITTRTQGIQKQYS